MCLRILKKIFFPDCPLYEANIENVEQKLEELIINENLRVELGFKGVKFVKENFDNEKILNDIEKIYEEI